MKVLHYLGIASVIIAMGYSSSTAPTNSVKNSSSPGFVGGYVSLLDSLGNFFRGSDTGIHVSLDPSALETITNSSGDWEIDSIPAGTYDITIRKDGYGMSQYFGIPIGGPHWMEFPSVILSAPPQGAPMLDSVAFAPPSSFLIYAGASQIPLVLIDHAPDVHSEEPHDTILIATFASDGNYYAGLSKYEWQAWGLHRGDTIFVSGCYSNILYDGLYWNPHLRKTIAISAGSKSNVIKIILP